MAASGRARKPTTWARSTVGFAIIALVLFEFGVRQIQPDALEYIAPPNCPDCGTTPGKVYWSTNPRSVAGDFAMVRSSSRSLLTPDDFLNHCPKGLPMGGVYRFTWHGLPVAVISDAFTPCNGVMISSGGLPDPWLYQIPFRDFYPS